MAMWFRSRSVMLPSLRNRTATKTLIVWCFLCVVFIVNVDAARSKRKDVANPNARSLRVINRSGSTIDVFWIHSVTGELSTSQTNGDGIHFGSETGISSYVGHAFLVQEIPKNKGDKYCKKKLKLPCRNTTFVCNANDDQWITIDGNFTVVLQDAKSRARSKAKLALSNCTANIFNSTASDTLSSLQLQQQIDALTACFVRQAELAINKTVDEVSFQSTIRHDMGRKLSKYSCSAADFAATMNVTTSPSILNTSYALSPNEHLLVQTLFASDASRIRLYPDFVSNDECQSILTSRKVVASKTNTLPNKIKALLSTELPGDAAVVQKLLHQRNAKTNPIVHMLESSMSTRALLDKSSATAAQRKTATTTKATDDALSTCEVQADGSCVTTVANNTASTTKVSPLYDDTDSTAAAHIYYNNDDGKNVAVRLLLYCIDDSSSNETTTATTNTTNTNTTTSHRGLLVFPNTGVRVVATHRAAVLIEYRDVVSMLSSSSATATANDSTDNDDAAKKEEPYLDEHVICAGSGHESDDTTPSRVAIVEAAYPAITG